MSREGILEEEMLGGKVKVGVKILGNTSAGRAKMEKESQI